MMILTKYARSLKQMHELAGNKAERVLCLLGLARRAGKLLVGQDKVLTAAKTGARLLVVTSNDLASAVERSLKPHTERGSVIIITATDCDRASLGERVGVFSAQIAALPKEDGFSKKILNVLNDRSGADE